MHPKAAIVRDNPVRVAEHCATSKKDTQQKSAASRPPLLPGDQLSSPTGVAIFLLPCYNLIPFVFVLFGKF